MKFKLFTDSDTERLENSINEWLEENPGIEISFVNGSESRAKSQYGSSKGKTVYVFYKENLLP